MLTPGLLSVATHSCLPTILCLMYKAHEAVDHKNWAIGDMPDLSEILLG